MAKVSCTVLQEVSSLIVSCCGFILAIVSALLVANVWAESLAALWGIRVAPLQYVMMSIWGVERSKSGVLLLAIPWPLGGSWALSPHHCCYHPVIMGGGGKWRKEQASPEEMKLALHLPNLCPWVSEQVEMAYGNIWAPTSEQRWSGREIGCALLPLEWLILWHRGTGPGCSSVPLLCTACHWAGPPVAPPQLHQSPTEEPHKFQSRCKLVKPIWMEQTTLFS